MWDISSLTRIKPTAPIALRGKALTTEPTGKFLFTFISVQAPVHISVQHLFTSLFSTPLKFRKWECMRLCTTENLVWFESLQRFYNIRTNLSPSLFSHLLSPSFLVFISDHTISKPCISLSVSFPSTLKRDPAACVELMRNSPQLTQAYIAPAQPPQRTDTTSLSTAICKNSPKTQYSPDRARHSSSGESLQRGDKILGLGAPFTLFTKGRVGQVHKEGRGWL